MLWHCLWDRNENWSFPVLWPLLSFQNLLTYWVQHFNSIIFCILNSSAEILIPPKIVCVVMLPKAYLTSYSRMAGSRWVATPLWLSGPLRHFLCMQFFLIFLPPLFNLFCFCEVLAISVFYCAHPGMKYYRIKNESVPFASSTTPSIRGSFKNFES